MARAICILKHDSGLQSFSRDAVNKIRVFHGIKLGKMDFGRRLYISIASSRCHSTTTGSRCLVAAIYSK